MNVFREYLRLITNVRETNDLADAHHLGYVEFEVVEKIEKGHLKETQC